MLIKKWPLGFVLCSLLAVTSLTAETEARASEFSNNTAIANIGYFVQGTHAWVEFTSAIPGIAACVTTSPNWTKSFAFPITDDKGKALLSSITAAMLAGKRVSAKGTGACTSALTWGPGTGAGAPLTANVELLQQFTVRAD
jgi:hypothetical protein